MTDEDDQGRREQADRDRADKLARTELERVRKLEATTSYRSQTCKHGRLRSDCSVCNPPR